MFFQRILAWLAFAAGLVATGLGLIQGRVFYQLAWTPDGALGAAIFTAAYAAIAVLFVFLAPRWFAPFVAATVTAYSVVAAGPLAVAAFVFVLAVCFATGAYWMRRRPKAVEEAPAGLVVLGLGFWIFFLTLSARFQIHYWPVYLILFLAVCLWAWSRQVLRFPKSLLPDGRDSALYFALPALPLLFHWLAALKPEVNASALGIHLAAPARMAVQHVWRFDVQQFAWAVKPMGGEWAFTLPYLFGGEPAARLFNASLLALLCWMLYGWLRDLLPGLQASLLTAVFASIPLVHRMTGSLRVENVAALTLAASVLFLRHSIKRGAPGYGYAALLLAGVTASVSMGALGFAAAALLAACLSLEWRTLLRGVPLALTAGLWPYLEAWQRTGNPLFPYFNDWFRSQLFDTTRRLIDAPGLESLTFANWWTVPSASSRFLGGASGAFGLTLLILPPLCLLAIRGNWPRIAWALLGVWSAGSAGLVVVHGSAESLYTGLPLLILSAGVMLATFRTRAPRFVHVLTAFLLLAFAGQLALLPVAAPEHRGFLLNQLLRPESVDLYLAEWAPQRPLVRELNRKSPTARVLWLESNAVAGFAGRVLSNTWHHQLFAQRLDEATSAEGLLFTMAETDLQYFIAPAPESPQPLRNIFAREFLDLYTRPELRFAGWELRRFTPPDSGQAPMRQDFAPPGIHDEVSPYVRYEGPWKRALDFSRAYRGTIVYANDVRARLFIRFQGRAITPIYTAAANRCEITMVLDDTEEKSWTQFARQTQWQARGPRLEAPPGHHTLEIRLPQAGSVTTAVNPCFLDLDAFIVE